MTFDDEEAQGMSSQYRFSLAVCCLLAVTSSAFALDGANPLNMDLLNGWEAFELVTQTNDISDFSDPGYGDTASRGEYDGLGAYLDGETLSIFVNHENGDAAISRVDLDLADFRQAVNHHIDDGATPFPASIVTGMGYAYDTIYDYTYHAIDAPDPVAEGTVEVGIYGDANFRDFCSGTAHRANSFGPGRGFVDEIYMTGEEHRPGKFFALDSATRTLWQVRDFRSADWENAAMVDTGNTTHVAMLLNSDSDGDFGDYMRFYVGKKGIDANDDGQIDFLERNGLRGGTLYYLFADDGFDTLDLPDGEMTGTWNTFTRGAFREQKVEDVHTNPHDGTQLVFAASRDGVYTMDFNMRFAGDEFDILNSTVTINQIDAASDAPIGAPDNLVWSANGKVYVQEDGNGDDMFEMNPDGTGLEQIASAYSEPSGIFDVSEWAGYRPGSVFLTSIMGGGTAGAQLSVMISPDAAVPEPAAIGLLLIGTALAYNGCRRRP